MNLQRIAIPERAARQFEALPQQVRHNVESFLENLDVLLSTSPILAISHRLERHSEDGFIGRVEGATIIFSIDPTARAAVIRTIELLASSPDRRH